MTSSVPSLLRVLVVASDPSSLASVVGPLRDLGHEVTSADDAAAAVRLAGSRPDVIVIDHQLSDLSGAHLCGRLKTQPATALIPILQLAPAESVARASGSGLGATADGFLAHPVDPEKLGLAIRALADHERLSQLAPPSEEEEEDPAIGP